MSAEPEAHTSQIATKLGIDRYRASVPPADRPSYVQTLRAEGGKLCYLSRTGTDAA